MDLTPEQMERVSEALRQGSPRLRALKLAGISKGEYRKILRMASDGVEPYLSFISAVDQAEAEAQQSHVQSIASSGDWRAHAFILERRFPEEWGQKIQFEVKRELEKVFAVAEEILPEEQFLRFLEGVSRIDSQADAGKETEARPLH